MTGPSVFGTRWRKMIFQVGTPIARAASTNSWCFKESTWPRTMRAIDRVYDAHHDVIALAADVARNGAVAHADDERDGGRDQPDHQRDAPADEHARQYVAPLRVCAHRVFPARRHGAHERAVTRYRFVSCARQSLDDVRADERRQHDQDNGHAAQHGQLILP